MKIKASLIAVSLAALVAACGQPAAQNEGAAATTASAPVELKAPAGVYALDPTHATLQASVLHNSISNYTVRFNKIDGKVTLDPANLENSSVEFTVDPSSVDANYPGDYTGTHVNSGFKSWNEDIANSPSNLNARQFPQMTFKSTKVTKTGERTADVTGDLTFLGVTKPVTFKATFNGEIESHPFLQVPAIGFAAEGTFKRTDFGMALGYVGDEVTVRFDGEFLKQADAAPAAAQ
ncbi:YceI family protein [uncultured Brevundimonas sp.]|uniref:YceI family protein n=1 Tax=uncultured Brevundimonas sp. TaxID=213418 RepID=UPI00260D5783|nr:YceI family protein [uncultured Brevundimonas sp.]